MIKPDFNKAGGLIPAIIQDHQTGDVLMLAYMNEDSWKKTLETGKATFWSRSRKELWVKGETSGNVQFVRDTFIDCDDDTILLKVEQVGGAACHTGQRSCFYRKLVDGELVTIGEPVFNPKDVYK
jgi:phosphoribosyl-AMP cyclohydrolase